MKKKEKSGFTFIELMFIMLIVSILAAISIPNFLRAQTNAKITRAYMDMHTISLGLESYAIDHRQYPPSKYTEIYDLEEIGREIQEIQEEREERYEEYPEISRHPHQPRIHRPHVSYDIETPIPEGDHANLVQKAAYKGVSSRHFPGNYEPIDWEILKEPVDYLHGMGRPFKDEFGSRHPPSYYWYYHLPSVYEDREKIDHTYKIVSQGPNMQFDYLDLSADIQEVLYDPTNGTVSPGDLIIKGP